MDRTFGPGIKVAVRPRWVAATVVVRQRWVAATVAVRTANRRSFDCVWRKGAPDLVQLLSWFDQCEGGPV